MEENELFQQPEASMFDVTISPSVAYSLKETCRWAALFAYIAGSLIILLALSFIVGWGGTVLRLPLFDSGYGSGFALGFIIAMVIIFGICIGLLVLLLIFSRKVKTGFQMRNLQMIEDGMASLKFYFTISGALAALFLAIGLFGILVLILR